MPWLPDFSALSFVYPKLLWLLLLITLLAWLKGRFGGTPGVMF